MKGDEDIQQQEWVPITPINFFQLEVPCFYLNGGFPALTGSRLRKYLLPDFSSLCGEKSFTQVAMGWNNEGIEIYTAIQHPQQKTVYPEVSKGDSVELFFDTRDVKTAGFNTRFCHHFFFLPEEAEGRQKGEMTRFRTEDVHERCSDSELKILVEKKHSSYTMNMWIPASCLYGYEPDQFDRIGFAYRINRSGGASQHFSVISDDFQLDQHPSLWSSIRLTQ